MGILNSSNYLLAKYDDMKFKSFITLSTFRHCALLAIAFTLPFDKWEAIYIAGFITVSKFFAIIYISLSILGPKLLFSINSHSKPFIYLIILWVILLFSSLLAHINYGYDIGFSVTYLTLIVMFLIISNEIYLYHYLRKYLFCSFIYSMLLVFILIEFNVGVQSSPISAGEEASLNTITRVWFFGLNPNDLGVYSALAILFCLFIIFEYSSHKLSKLYYAIAILPLLYLLGYAGSAGAALALIVSIILFFTIKNALLIAKIRYLLIGILILSIGIYFIIDSFEYLTDKLELFFETGNATGRLAIWESALSIIVNHPVIGMGQQGGAIALFHATAGFQPTAHNVYLDVMLWSGVIGLSVFIVFYLSMLKRAIIYRKNMQCVSSIIIVVFIALIIGKAGGGFTYKFAWLFLPCATVIGTLPYERRP